MNLGGSGGSSSDATAGNAKSSGFMSMFGATTKQPSTVESLGAKLNTAASQVASGELPTFTEDSAFSMCCPNLTYRQRVYGFVGSCIVGWLLSLVGTLTLIGGPTQKNIATFAILYVTGNIVALMGTGFLLGPATQCRKMWDATRRFSAAFYLSMLVVVFAVAVSGQHVGIVIAMLVIQVLAGSWYALSYVPFGRKMVIAFFKNTLCKPCCDAYESTRSKNGGFSNATAQI